MSKNICILLLAGVGLQLSGAEEVLTFRHQEHLLRFRRLAPEQLKRVDDVATPKWTNVNVRHLQFATMLEVADQRAPDVVLNRAILPYALFPRTDPQPWTFNTNNFYLTDVVVTQSCVVATIRSWGEINLVAVRIAGVTNVVPADPVAAYRHQFLSPASSAFFETFWARGFGGIIGVETNTVHLYTVGHNGGSNVNQVRLPGL